MLLTLNTSLVVSLYQNIAEARSVSSCRVFWRVFWILNFSIQISSRLWSKYPNGIDRIWHAPRTRTSVASRRVQQPKRRVHAYRYSYILSRNKWNWNLSEELKHCQFKHYVQPKSWHALSWKVESFQLRFYFSYRGFRHMKNIFEISSVLLQKWVNEQYETAYAINFLCTI